MTNEGLSQQSSRRWLFVAFVTLLVITASAAPASAASQQSRFLDAVAAAYAHYRGAYSYLRTGNGALAALEIEQAQAKWREVVASFGATPPDAFAADPALRSSLDKISNALDQALTETDGGDFQAARHSLAPVRGDLAALRRRNSVTTFSDRVDEISAAMESLWLYHHNPPDFGAPATPRKLGSRTAVFTYMLMRAQETAPPALAESAEFQRLIGGALEGAERLWLALERKDQALLINTLRELRSFEQIIFLKFG